MAPAASPGCGVPARRTHLHHLLPWELGGPTDLANALSLCGAHHARLHEGHYQILGSPDGELRFETRDGRPIVPPPARIDSDQGGGTAHLRRLARERGHQISDGRPWALYGGQPPDCGLGIEMLIHNSKLRQARHGPSPGGFPAPGPQVLPRQKPSSSSSSSGSSPLGSGSASFVAMLAGLYISNGPQPPI